jgi:Na+/melibiose symporter-like transporter
VSDLVTHRFPIDRSADAYTLIENRAEPYLAITLTYTASQPPNRSVRLRPRPIVRNGPGIGLIGAGAFAALMLTLLIPSLIVSALWIIVPMLGVALSAMHVMPTAILPEAIEDADQGKSGEGMHYGIINFIYMVVNAPVQFGVLGILGLAGYIETTEEAMVAQPASALLAIRILIVVVPVVLLVLGVVAAKLFRIGRQPVTQGD